jgi:hypothetical protein
MLAGMGQKGGFLGELECLLAATMTVLIVSSAQVLHLFLPPGF